MVQWVGLCASTVGGKGFVSGLRTKTSPGAWYNPGLLRVSAPWSGGQYGVGDPGFPLISHQNPEAEKGSRTHSSNLRRKKKFITQVITSPGLSSFLKLKGKELPKLDTRQKRSREGAVLKARKSLLRFLLTKANLTLTMMSLYFLNLNFCYLMKSEVWG